MSLRQSQLYYYADKKSFEERPDNHLNRRPTSLEGMSLQVLTQEPPFELILQPIDLEDERKAITFRCDTVGEVTPWIEHIQQGIQAAGTYTISAVEVASSTQSVSHAKVQSTK